MDLTDLGALIVCKDFALVGIYNEDPTNITECREAWFSVLSGVCEEFGTMAADDVWRSINEISNKIILIKNMKTRGFL